MRPLTLQHRLEDPLEDGALLEEEVGVHEHAGAAGIPGERAHRLALEAHVDAVHGLLRMQRADAITRRPHVAADVGHHAAILAEALEGNAS
jgi:hypothetical protein